MADPDEDVEPERRARMQALFKATPIHALLGLEIRSPDPADPELVIVDMPVAPGAFGSTGNVHGGAIAVLLDVACASAAGRSSSYRPGDNTIVTADTHIRYLGRTTGTMLRAEARVVRAGRSLVIVEGKVLDDRDTLIAVCDFAAMVVDNRPPLVPELQTDPDAPVM